MKFLYLLLIIVVSACGTSKNNSKSANTVLFHGYSEELNGYIDLILIKSSEINCTANIIQVHCDKIDASQLILTATNGEVTLKLLDDKSYYFTPNCNDKKVELIIRSTKDTTVILAKIVIHPKK